MTTMDRFTASRAPVKRVKAIQLGVWDPDEIKKYSVCHVESPELFEKGKPKAGGLSDPRMGTMDKFGGICTTDGANMHDCPGYFGHVELAEPVYHCGFIKTIIRILRCVGHYNSKILLDHDDPKFRAGTNLRKPQARLKHFVHLCGGKRMDDAGGNPQPSYKLDGMKIMMEFPKVKDPEAPGAMPEAERKQELSAKECHRILQGISDEDCKALGFDVRYSKPAWLLVSVLPVPPPPVRPSVMMDSSARCEDDLTHKLVEIVRANNTLKRMVANGSPQHIINEYVQLLQFHVTTYMDNTMPGMNPATQRSGRPIKSISQRLKGKSGRIRGNLMGKRVDFSARTVITGDPNIGIDELGVPWTIAQNLTFPETVTPFNRDKLQALVDKGPHAPSGETGAKFIIRKDGRRINLAYIRHEASRELEIGDKVERTLQNGDLVLFNRQPSLHKMSMMGHRIRILPYSTFRLNLSVTTPYNADFDGDEMNMHVAQSHETRAEMREIMMVPNNIVSPQANKPVIGIVQDTLLGCKLITQRDTFIKKDVMMNILMNIMDWDGTVPLPTILKPEPLWTGKQVFSHFLNKQLCLMGKSSWYSDKEKDRDFTFHDSAILIKKGILIYGCLCKKTLGTSKGGLVHITWNQFGPDETRKTINNIQFTVNHWLLHHGMSIGIGDTVADAATGAHIANIIDEAKNKVKGIIEEFQTGKLEGQPGRTLMESFEAKVNSVLNKARDDAGKSAQASLDWSNNIIKMVTSGSKGSFINISQMMACVGQQNVEGKRIPFGFVGRTLPHFSKDDYGPESRGFVENSYLQGLSPQEFFFHAMGGREGLIDTAVKTSSTGYIQRRLVKAMEDLIIKYDGTIRNSAGDVVQFLYGEDGMDAVRIEEQHIEHLKWNPYQLRKAFSFDHLNNAATEWLGQQQLEAVRNNAETREKLDGEYQHILDDLHMMRQEVLTNGHNTVNIPLNLKRFIWLAQNMFNCGPDKPPVPDLMATEIVDRMQELTQKLIVVVGQDDLSKEAQRNATTTFMTQLRSTLASKRVLSEYKLDRKAFNWLVGEIEDRFYKALANAGEAIGTVAAQSIGEPTTQMTLNTFHFAGVSAKNVTLGVPRLTEIINLAKNIKTPSLTVALMGQYSRDRDAAKEMQCKLEYTSMRNIIARSEVWYDPPNPEDPTATFVEDDKPLLEDWYAVEEYRPERLTPWLLRLVLDDRLTVDKHITMQQVMEKIQEEYEGLLDVIVSDENAPIKVVRIRIVDDSGGQGAPAGGLEEGDELGAIKPQAGGDGQEVTEETLKKLDAGYLRDMKLQGVERINKVFLRQQDTLFPDVNAETGFRTDKEWVLDTEGVNLMGVLPVPGVDSTRTISNDLIEIIQELGVEACRQALLRELRSVIEFDGSYVNYRHLAILCDVMTCRGHLMAITRHGINRTDASPLAQCSFEETVDILLRAAMFAEKDRMMGVSENIMLGQLCPLGTGAFDLLLNEDDLAQANDLLAVQNMDDENVDYGYATDNAMTPGRTPAHMTPSRMAYMTPSRDPDQIAFSPTWSPVRDIQFSPARVAMSPAMSPGAGGTAYSPTSPSYSPTSPQYSPTSPGYSPTSPGYSPTSPGYSPTSPGYSPTSPGYSPTSPGYSPTSPGYSPTSPGYSPTSPGYSPTSPQYSPTSPNHSPTSPSYSPTSPSYSPTSPTYSPTSPTYSPTSPTYSPTSPTYSPTSPTYSPTSPTYSPTSPTYSPTSPTYSPTSPTYSPTSPTYSPTSPTYSPTSPKYSPSSPTYSPTSPKYSPTSPSYNPSESAAAASPAEPDATGGAATSTPAAAPPPPATAAQNGSYSPADDDMQMD